MEELKKVFDACRAYRGHSIPQAASKMGEDGYSKTTLDRFFNNDLEYTEHVDSAVRDYIYHTGLVKAINELGLNPDDTKSKLANAKN